jgi:hypothetical protein
MNCGGDFGTDIDDVFVRDTRLGLPCDFFQPAWCDKTMFGCPGEQLKWYNPWAYRSMLKMLYTR